MSKLTWNEYYHHFSRQLLEQFKWEITVLGFLALIVYFAHKGFFDIVAGGRDMRWGAQTHGQVFIAVEDAHFSLFSAVVCYFVSLAFILTMTLRLMAPHIQHERALALQRAKDRDVEITTNAAGAACPVGELEKVLDDKYAVQLARRLLAAAEGEAPAQPTADAMEVDDDDADEEAPSQEAVLALWREAHAMAAEGAE